MPSIPDTRPDGSRLPLGEVTNTAAAKKTANKAGKAIETVDLAGSSFPTAAAPNTGDKRPRPQDITSEDLDDFDGCPIDQNADQIRRKIHRVIDNGELKVNEFCKTLNVSTVGYYRFMKQSGPTKGLQSDVFSQAWAYFKTRELAGIKLPTAQRASKKAKPAEEGGEASTKKSEAAAAKEIDLSDIHLDGEETDSVPVYLTCDAVRRQISAHMRKTGVSQAQFCRDLNSQWHGETKINANAVARFRGRSGSNGGATTNVFYAAYVYFEKLRIKEGRKKAKAQEMMEEVWGAKGMDRSQDEKTRLWVHTTAHVTVDQYGATHITKG